MSRLPTVGGDDNSWGDVLNDFLGVEHNVDGTQKTLPLTKGGTGGTTAASARTNLGAEASANKGIAGGYAPLDGTGKVPAGNLPAGSGTTDTNAVHKGDLVYNVKDYGAVGNGVADDRAAVQAAIDAAQNTGYGSIVYFPGGRYKINETSAGSRIGLTLNPSRPLTLLGTARGRNNDGSSLYTGTNTSGMTLITQGTLSALNTYDGATLENLYLYDIDGGNTLVHLVQENFTTIRDCTFYGDSNATVGLFVDFGATSGSDSSWHTIDNCIFSHCGTGIQLLTFGVVVSNCTFEIPAGKKGIDFQQWTDGSLCQNVRVVNCKVDGGSPVFGGYMHCCTFIGVAMEGGGDPNFFGWNFQRGIDNTSAVRNRIIGCNWTGSGQPAQKVFNIDSGGRDNDIVGLQFVGYGTTAFTDNGTNTQIIGPGPVGNEFLRVNGMGYTYGTGAPGSLAGNNGSHYTDTSTGEEWVRISGTWHKLSYT